MRLRRHERCPIHKSLFCCGRETLPHKPQQIRPGVQPACASTRGCGLGCLISWHENDEIQACFDEEMRCIGQEGPLEPPIVLAIPLRGSVREKDGTVKRFLLAPRRC